MVWSSGYHTHREKPVKGEVKEELCVLLQWVLSSNKFGSGSLLELSLCVLKKNCKHHFTVFPAATLSFRFNLKLWQESNPRLARDYCLVFFEVNW